MTDVLEARASTGTHTIQRFGDNTETRVRREIPLGPAQERSRDALILFTLVQPETRVATPSIGLGIEFILAASDDQAYAILTAPGLGYSSRLQHALPSIASRGPLVDALRDELEQWPFEFEISDAHRRLPGYVLSLEGRPGVHQPENRDIRFRSQLLAALRDEPIEDGVTHPAENIIDEALRADPSDCKNWLTQVLVDHCPARPSLCAAIVRCIGRLDYNRVRGWGMRVIDDQLKNRDAEIREAAVRALEAWGGPAALHMLRRHEDAEAWLNEYVQQVIVDMSEPTP